VLHLQEFFCGSLDMFANLVAVSRTIEKGSQDEHVERSLEEPNPLLRLFLHRRHSTLNLDMMVDSRLSIVKTREAVWTLE
jgi:hypothetical protein